MCIARRRNTELSKQGCFFIWILVVSFSSNRLKKDNLQLFFPDAIKEAAKNFCICKPVAVTTVALMSLQNFRFGGYNPDVPQIPMAFIQS